MSRDREPYPRWTRVVWGLAGTALVGAMYAGAFAAVAGWRAGLALAVGAATLLFLVHLGIGIVAYRHAMRRPWPRVAPVADDDWD